MEAEARAMLSDGVRRAFAPLNVFAVIQEHFAGFEGTGVRVVNPRAT